MNHLRKLSTTHLTSSLIFFQYIKIERKFARGKPTSFAQFSADGCTHSNEREEEEEQKQEEVHIIVNYVSNSMNPTCASLTCPFNLTTK